MLIKAQNSHFLFTFSSDLLLKVLIRAGGEERKKNIKTSADGYKDQKCIAARRKQLLELNIEWFSRISRRLNHIELSIVESL